MHSLELREKEWDLAARVRERALAEARDQVALLVKELAIDRAELRARDVRIADLETQLEEHREQLATVIARAIAKRRSVAVQKPRRKMPTRPKKRITVKGRASSKRTSGRSRRRPHG